MLQPPSQVGPAPPAWSEDTEFEREIQAFTELEMEQVCLVLCIGVGCCRGWASDDTEFELGLQTELEMK